MSEGTCPHSKGVIKRLRSYFFKYPESKPKAACRILGLDPKQYGATARVVKSRARKVWFQGAESKGLPGVTLDLSEEC